MRHALALLLFLFSLPALAAHGGPLGKDPYYLPVCGVTALHQPSIGYYHLLGLTEPECHAEVARVNNVPLDAVNTSPFRCDSFPGSQPDICGVLYGSRPGSHGSWLYFVEKTNVVKLTPVAPIDSSIEPGKKATWLARVYDKGGQLVPNVSVKLDVAVTENSGGHLHTVNRPPGDISPSEGSTGTAGLTITFTAPAVSGDHTVTVQCADGKCGQATGKVWVGIKDLVSLSPSADYVLIGQLPEHPAGHYLTGTALYRVTMLASLYRRPLSRLFPNLDFRLHLNDASLEHGGIFDILNDWKRPHAEHCLGTVIDIRANDAPGAIPDRYRLYFEDKARFVGADPLWEIPQDANGNDLLNIRHYHVRLMKQEGLACAR